MAFYLRRAKIRTRASQSRNTVRELSRFYCVTFNIIITRRNESDSNLFFFFCFLSRFSCERLLRRIQSVKRSENSLLIVQSARLINDRQRATQLPYYYCHSTITTTTRLRDYDYYYDYYNISQT